MECFLDEEGRQRLVHAIRRGRTVIDHILASRDMRIFRVAELKTLMDVLSERYRAKYNTAPRFKKSVNKDELIHQVRNALYPSAETLEMMESYRSMVSIAQSHGSVAVPQVTPQDQYSIRMEAIYRAKQLAAMEAKRLELERLARRGPDLSVTEEVWASDALAKARGPFVAYKQIFAQQCLSEGLCANLRFVIPDDIFACLRRQYQPQGKYAVHARVYSTEEEALNPWASTYTIILNNIMVSPPPKSKLKPSLNTPFQTIRPLDITNAVNRGDNHLRINVHAFLGVAVVELVELVSVEAVMEQVKARASENTLDSKQFKCHVCKKEEDLKRCSRCKDTYYCSREHQVQDWPTHSLLCVENPETPPVTPQEDMRLPIPKNEDEEIEESFWDVSMKCPLLVDVMEVPVKGTNCTHLGCFDLHMYLLLCERSHIWRCPICNKSCPPWELLVDPHMTELIKRAPEDVEDVRVFPDGTFEFQMEEAEEVSDDDSESTQSVPQPDSKRFKAASPTFSPPVIGSQAEPICID